MKIQLSLQTLILRCIQSNIKCSEAARMVEVIFSDRKAEQVAVELYKLSESKLLQCHRLELITTVTTVCGLTENIQTVSGTEYALKVARIYDKVYNS